MVVGHGTRIPSSVVRRWARAPRLTHPHTYRFGLMETVVDKHIPYTGQIDLILLDMVIQ